MHKYQQNKHKKLLKILKNHMVYGVLSSLFGLAACQSSTPSGMTTKSSSSSVERPLKVTRLSDGIQDVKWDIVQISGNKAKFFHSIPYLLFNSQFKQIQGNTGCNRIEGNYVMDTVKGSIDLNARAGYLSCDSALAQEAELSDVLQAVTQFQIQGKRMTMQNSRGQTLLVLERKSSFQYK